MKTFEIWAEGFGGHPWFQGTHKLVGTQEAETFEEACILLPNLIEIENVMTYGGRRLFDNESKAAEAFG